MARRKFKGTEVFNVDDSPVVARGHEFAESTMDHDMASSVVAALRDAAGTERVASLIAGLATTDFAKDRVEAVLSPSFRYDDWRIGEVLGEFFLTDNKACFFPWPSSRDLRNPRSVAAGTDLVGFMLDVKSHRFAFAEVKTSSEEQSPPRVMSGSGGICNQLVNLIGLSTTKDYLVLYLGQHAYSADWLDVYRQAAGRYFADPNDVAIFGVLVRNQPSRSTDLESSATELSRQHEEPSALELHGLYIPDSWFEKVAVLCAEGSDA